MLSPDKNRVVSEMKSLSFSAHRRVYLIPIEGAELKFEELCKAWWRFRWTDSMISIYGEPDISTRFERHTSGEDALYATILPPFENFISAVREIPSSNPIWLILMSPNGEELVIRRALADELAVVPIFAVLKFSRPIHRNVEGFITNVAKLQRVDPGKHALAVIYERGETPTIVTQPTERSPLLDR